MRAACWALAAVVLATAASAGADVRFRFPGSDEHRPHFYVTAYRDNGGLQDYQCGSTTYSGHRGTDMGAGSFAGMDAGRDIVAAADGVVSYVHDGVFDRCTSGTCGGGGGFGNYVRIDHSDGKVTYYGHLKKFSITVSVGDEVSCGQVIGEMGSSGNSTGPHLHFEPRIDNVSDDPYSGPCGGPISWWVEQGAYEGLPEPVCQDSSPSHPTLDMDAELSGKADDGGKLEVGDEAVARFYVRASESDAVARDVVLGIEAPDASLSIRDWTVFDDFHANDCGGEFCPNDANDHPDNPPRELPGDHFDLHINALSPGETKMIELGVRAEAESARAALRVWVAEVPGSYRKDGFDSEPENVDGAQVYNGGDLKTELVVAIGSADDGGGAPPGDPPSPTEPSGGEIGGGCAAAPGSAAGIAHALVFAAWLFGLARRRRRHQRPS